jgi:hypothetical protein
MYNTHLFVHVGEKTGQWSNPSERCILPIVLLEIVQRTRIWKFRSDGPSGKHYTVAIELGRVPPVVLHIMKSEV